MCTVTDTNFFVCVFSSISGTHTGGEARKQRLRRPGDEPNSPWAEPSVSDIISPWEVATEETDWMDSISDEGSWRQATTMNSVYSTLGSDNGLAVMLDMGTVLGMYNYMPPQMG